ncbi:AAA family ATPase [Pseudomonas profundi]|uniref:AAA family ATPase n=1 Tax=Pseudomonas profundi TaxID=1981513 RepID=UPI00123B139B|nr:AAA family ATPase [Pseudomonas profundi]
MPPQKQLWILTGGNGAGKSTFYRLFLEPRGMVFINADNIARDLSPDNPEEASYRAARLAEVIRYELLQEGATFCYETVFSHPSKIDFVAEARARGYQVILVFIHLDGSDLNKARVAQRVGEGGHAVPENKIESRIPRTLGNVRWALALANEVHVIDNSSLDQPFVRIARLREGVLERYQPLDGWAEALLSEYL